VTNGPWSIPPAVRWIIARWVLDNVDLFLPDSGDLRPSQLRPVDVVVERW
jgi:hypothetical protein